ncbi:MAG: HEAT repeat domain-containing protein [Deltaproteobacteria bacterium]|nr:HEAT repeat domain-containing protein [Deltaproteobacteria bacterium]
MTRKRFLSDLMFPAPILAGMLVCHVFSTLWVYAANSGLYEKMALLAKSGYVTVPNPVTAPLLKTFATAFYGGLFFTFTLGAGLCVLSFFLFRFWFRFFPRAPKKVAAALFSGIFLLIAVFLNKDGFVLFPTLIALSVPATVILISALVARYSGSSPSLLMSTFFIVPLVILSLAWGGHKDDDLFDHLRDDVLLSGGPGIAFVDFYYRYTLYPTEPIKPLAARLIKSARITGQAQPATLAPIYRALIKNDYLPVKSEGPVDLSLNVKGSVVTLSGGGKIIDEIGLQAFVQKPDRHLSEFSKKLDNMAASRTFMGFGLLFGFPLVLYSLCFGFVSALVGLMLAPAPASFATGLLGVVLGLLLLFPLSSASKARDRDIRELIASGSRSERLTGLRQASEKGIPVCNLAGFDKILKSSAIVERRWAAEALASGGCPETGQMLAGLLNDPHPYVRCHAVLSLSRIGASYATDTLLDILRTSNHWYLETYSYSAARSLGWHQQAQ